MGVSTGSMPIRSRFALVLVVTVPTLLAVMGVGVATLESARNTANVLYVDHELTTRSVVGLHLALEHAHQSSLQILLADTSTHREQLTSQLVTRQVPAVQTAIGIVSAAAVGDRIEQRSMRKLAGGWAAFEKLLDRGRLAPAAPAVETRTATEVQAAFDVAAAAATEVLDTEVAQADRAHRNALADYRSSLELLLIVGVLGLLCSVGIVVWLIRSVLPRTLAYAAFADRVRRGDYTQRLRPGGHDELAQLGRVLDELAERRQADDAYDREQLDLNENLQLTESEQEARDLVKRHLERAVPGNQVTIMNRNNSADRLQAVTVVEAGSPLADGLDSAKPRSCLAIRKARPHAADSAQDSLLGCPVCSGCPGRITCTPLIVSGEVIGSVLANHEEPLSETDQRSIREAVTQAAPVMGNLRNLAIAELRAATDALTGLPNKRAIENTIRRMTAQATRTMSPLTALMCDLDHFKHINDQHGHGRGDDVLAAVGAALSASIRVSDFAGRYGGEEFLVLLPDTDRTGGAALAAKIRSAVAAIRVPSVTAAITMSVGIATLPDHALDAVSLERAADRALYTAKNAGRDRIEIFTTHQMPAELDSNLTTSNGHRPAAHD